MFLVFIHILPVWFARREPIQWIPTVAVFVTYFAFLAAQGLDFTKVYGILLREPPVTILEYLKSRSIYKSNEPSSGLQ